MQRLDHFAYEGAKIALLARGRDGLEGARRDVEAAGGKTLMIPTDVANPIRSKQQRKQLRKLGPIQRTGNAERLAYDLEFCLR